LFHLPDLDTDFDCGYSVYLTGNTDFDRGLFRFPDLNTQILTIGILRLNEAHGGCDRSTGDAYSLTPDPTSGSPWVRVCLIFCICILYGIYETDLTLFVILLFHSDEKKKKDDSLVSKMAIYIN
jgi:hypothetical protein